MFVACVVDGMTPEQFAELFALTSETVEARPHNARSLLFEVIRQFGPAFGSVYQLDDSRSERITNPALIQTRSHRGGLACCGCRHHLAVSSIGVLSITLRFCRDASMHLAKGTEKATVAPITDRPRDLLN